MITLEDIKRVEKDFYRWRYGANPLLSFVNYYNYMRDKSDAGQSWAEQVLNDLVRAKSVNELNHFKQGDWFMLSRILQSGLTLPIPIKIIGEALEKILDALSEPSVNIDVPVLGIEKLKRGRPQAKNKAQHEQHIFFKVRMGVEQGRTKDSIFAEIGEQFHKSPDAIRKTFERYSKQKKQQRKQLQKKFAGRKVDSEKWQAELKKQLAARSESKDGQK